MNINDRVILATLSHGASFSNPAYGTKYSCEGTIILNEFIYVHVAWDNGKINTYLKGDLTVVSKRIENYKSIW